MQVPVTLFDLVGVARYRTEPLRAVYRRYYFVGVLPREGHGWLKSVSLKLKKPCPFLIGKRCAIYPVRPLSCILFPEYHAVDGTLKTLQVQDAYKDYLCLRHPIALSRKRTRVLRTLARMLQRELVVSDSYLFDRSPFWIDSRSVVETLGDDLQTDPVGVESNESLTTNVIPFETLDQWFGKTFAKCRPFSDLDARIERLGGEDQQARFFAQLNDRKLLKAFLRESGDRPLVFSFSFLEGKLEARRKSLAPRERIFM